MELVPVREEEVPEVTELIQRYVLEVERCRAEVPDPEYVRRWFHLRRTRVELYRVLVDDVVHGVLSLWPEDRELYLRYYWVGPVSEVRRIVTEVLKWVKRRGSVEEIYWSLPDCDVELRSAVEEQGFQLVREFLTMRIKAEDLARQEPRPGLELELKLLNPNTREGLQLLVDLYNKTFREHFHYRPMTVEDMEEWLLPELYRNYLYVAYYRGEPVGYTYFGYRIRDPEVGWIHQLGVVPEYRRRGIGTTLLIYAARYLLREGVQEIYLSVDRDNPTGARRLYEKLGFTRHHSHLLYCLELRSTRS